MKDMIKTTWFLSHNIGMHVTPFLWIFHHKMLYVYFIILVSWMVNNNNCLVSQMEYLIWKETFRGRGKVFRVPRRHRLILYSNFFLGIFYYYYINGKILRESATTYRFG